jgi:multidrug efflux pump subunit AcrA (membrane-fusion protein)
MLTNRVRRFFPLLPALLLFLSPGLSAQHASEEPLPVPVAEVSTERITAPATYGARVRAGQEYSVGAPIGGFVESLRPELGDEVAAGEEVATIRRSSPGEEFRPATVASRFSGTVVSREVRPGQYVGSGQELIRLADTRRTRLLVQVSDKDIADINQGDPARVAIPSTEEEVAGVVRRVYPQGELERGLFTVEVELPGNGRRIGAYAEVTLQVRPFTGVLVPSAAVTEREGGAFLFVVENGVARRREVTIGEEYGERVAVVAGLEAGERYVSGRVQGIREGRPVRPREAAGARGSDG